MPFILDPNGPHFDDQGRPIVIPPPGMEHEDLLNIPGQMPGFEATPVKAPSQVQPIRSQIPQTLGPASQAPPAITDTPVKPSQGPLITPSEPTSIDTDIEQLRKSMPTPDQFHESRGKRILEAIIAGAAGAAGGPRAGIEVAHELSPYRKALEVWQNKQKPLELGVQREQQRFERGKEEAAAQSRKEGLLLEQMGIKSKDNRDRYSQILEEKRLMMEQQKEDSAEYYNNMQAQLHLLDIEKPDPFEREIAFFQANPEAYKKYQEAKNLGTAKDLNTWLIKQEIKAKMDVTTDINKKKAEKEFRETSTPPELIDKAKEMAATNPAAFMDWMKLQNKTDQSNISRQVPMENLITDPQGRISVRNATGALNQVDNVRSMLATPFIRDNIGAIAGRIKEGESALGGDTIGKTPEERTAEQRFLSDLNQLLVWETRTAAGGTRPAHQLFALMKQTSPRASMGPDQIEGALQAVEDNANTAISAAFGKRTGAGNPSVVVKSIDGVEVK